MVVLSGNFSYGCSELVENCKMSLNHTQALLTIMARLRKPDGGCPWDLEQDFASIAPYTIEEAYEVAEAIRLNDMTSLKEELGDLLLQVVFHAQMAKEAGLFDFEDVAAGIAEKMEQRHPHVFGEVKIESAQSQTENWEKIKAEERRKKSSASLMSDIPLALPALIRAEKLQKRAARAGFDWPDAIGVRAKIAEELAECDAAMQHGDKEKIAEELGDLMFSVANLARFYGLDPEAALRATNDKFTARFQYIERALAQRGKTFEQSNLDEMETLWQEAKRA
ncbi:MAG: nucleoside triphosphate pyrophosphohydrolase [Alphaproteobacteria bacterium]